MLPSITEGTTGYIILTIIIIIIFFLVTYAILIYKENACRNIRKPSSANSSTNTYRNHKYSVLDYPDTSSPSLSTKMNIIQPPYHANIKVKLIPSTSVDSNSKKSIKYTEIDEEEVPPNNITEIEKNITETNDNDTFHQQQQNSFGQSIHICKDKITGFLKKNRNTENIESNDNEWKIWKPDPVTISPEKKHSLSYNANNKFRLQRPDSILLNEESLGRITFTLYYSTVEEYLTLLLISGRQINSCDATYSIRLPVVSIIIENSPFSEVTSNPDEAPNPEYDQEFTFTIRPADLHDMVLQFTIWDIISNHETRVVGFFRVQLVNFQKTLLEGDDSGPICREIQPCLSTPSFVIGQLLIALLYDCVTDKILVNIRQCKQLALNKEDIDIYLKVSLLLDNDIIASKRSITFNCKKNFTLNQSFEFSALSDELDKMSTTSSPTLRVADELLTNASLNYKKSLVIADVQSVKNNFASDTLRNHMGVLISVRASTGNKNKRVVGRLYLGKTNIPYNDEEFHWNEMIRNFDNTITQWHHLRLDRL